MWGPGGATLPDDDALIGQNEVDVRNEPRRDVYACHDPEAAWIQDQQASFCTNDTHCKAAADEHDPGCPKEQQLQDELGF